MDLDSIRKAVQLLISLFENLYTAEPIDLTQAMCSLMGLFIHEKRGHAQYCITLIESIMTLDE